MESIKKLLLYDFFMILKESNRKHRGYDDDDDGRDDDERHAWRKGKIRCYTREKIFHAWSQKNQNWKETSHIEGRKESGCCNYICVIVQYFLLCANKIPWFEAEKQMQRKGKFVQKIFFPFLFLPKLNKKRKLLRGNGNGSLVSQLLWLFLGFAWEEERVFLSLIDSEDEEDSLPSIRVS